MAQIDHVRRIRICLSLFIIGLLLSGLTAFPLQTELRWLVTVLHYRWLMPAAQATQLLPWIEGVFTAIRVTNEQYPFLAYGTDWLAFAHLIIAIAFVGPYVDPVRNKWLIAFGLIACAGIIPLALIAGQVRSIPLQWRLIDCSFGIFGSIPLFICHQSIRTIERQGGQEAGLMPEDAFATPKTGTNTKP